LEVELVLGQRVSGVIGRPGDAARYAFTGSAGQRLYYDAQDADFDSLAVRLTAPSGGVVSINHNADSDVGPFTLVENGRYTLTIDGNGDVTGDFAFQLLDARARPALTLGAIEVGARSGEQRHRTSLRGVAGQRLYLDGRGTNSGGNGLYGRTIAIWQR
jgi:hypothetical protein